jgi:hypothetical protein
MRDPDELLLDDVLDDDPANYFDIREIRQAAMNSAADELGLRRLLERPEDGLSRLARLPVATLRRLYGNSAIEEDVAPAA